MSTDPKTTIAFLRTGLIGAPVARNLRKRGGGRACLEPHRGPGRSLALRA